MDKETFDIAQEQVKKACGFCLKRYKLYCSLSVQDLYQQAWIGIAKAEKKYRPEKGSKAPFFYAWAKGEIRNYLRSKANTSVGHELAKIKEKDSSLLVKSSDEDSSISYLGDIQQKIAQNFSYNQIIQALDQVESGGKRNFPNPVLKQIENWIDKDMKLLEAPVRKRKIVLVDYSVLSWTVYMRITGTLGTMCNQFKSLCVYNWGEEFKKIITLFPEHEIILGLDLKNEDKQYWRHSFLESYKDGRREKPEAFLTCYKEGIELGALKGFQQLSYEGLEYDDIGAIMARFQREKKTLADLVLYTIDGDLLQLVDDESFISFYTPRKPFAKEVIQTQHRKEKDVLDYCEHHFKTSVKHPKELARLKAIAGEKADNIPAGLDYLELIDLYDCHIKEVNNIDQFKTKLKKEFF
jgi:RNA polymerase sigma factor (sigma-70 family)